MKISVKIDPKEFYLLACSYGPDSMALLHVLLKHTKNIIVCHVNYHKREESTSEEKSLKSFCKENNIRFEKYDAPKKNKGNFQAWARNTRYDFFKDVYGQYNAKALFVAHQEDDVIETYLIQKQRNNRVKLYGIPETSIIRGMNVIRPILIYSKEDILNYCRENLIPYSIDSSNFETKFLRNKIRLHVVEKMNNIERHKVLEKIKNENYLLQEKRNKLQPILKEKSLLKIDDILTLKVDDFCELIYLFFEQNNYPYSLSKKTLLEVRKICQSSKPNLSLVLRDNFMLIKEYDDLVLMHKIHEAAYSFTLEKPDSLYTPYFDLDFSKGATDRNIYLEDYPLTIRSFNKEDEYQINNYFVKVRRLFIDWKMPTRLRNFWPIVLNHKGEIIYIPRYRKNFEDNYSSKFFIKI